MKKIIQKIKLFLGIIPEEQDFDLQTWINENPSKFKSKSKLYENIPFQYRDINNYTKSFAKGRFDLKKELGM